MKTEIKEIDGELCLVIKGLCYNHTIFINWCGSIAHNILTGHIIGAIKEVMRQTGWNIEKSKKYLAPYLPDEKMNCSLVRKFYYNKFKSDHPQIY